MYADASVAYQETWNGSAATIEGAIPLLLHQGQQLTGLQITAKRERLFHITVRPSGPREGSVMDRYDVLLPNRNHSSTRMKDGSYMIPDLPAGHHTVVSTAWSGTTYVGQGQAEFDVIDADVAVDVPVEGLGAIGGVLTEEAGTTRPIAEVTIGITSQERRHRGERSLLTAAFSLTTSSRAAIPFVYSRRSNT
ncbi:MAG: hypothetical protein ACRYFU_22140 [Janthinobacterium lividum]